MATSHGKNADVVVGGVRLATIFRSMSFSVDIDTGETSTFLQDWKTFLAGQGGSTVELEGLYDNVLSVTPRSSLFSDSNIVTLGPAGLAFGARAQIVDVTTTNYTESASVGDVVLANWALQSDGETGYGFVYRGPEQAAVTVTGNGTSIDLLAPVTGAVWAFNAHVTAISGTSPAVVLSVEDSADNSSFSTLAGATTSSITAAGAQRITGTGTVRRYVRVRHVVSGTTPSVAYIAAFSRRTP